jgi:4-hydroxybenzoate polyprenyltransferase
MAMGLAVAALLSPMTCLLVALYVVSTTLYSLWLKRKMLVDVFMLAMLYTLRVLIGGEATGVLSSVWLLAFSIFTFLSLGAAKRGAELLHLERAGRMVTGGRDYYVWDRDAVAMIGLASAFGAALVLALYLQSDGVRLLYTQPSWLWLLVPLLLYWLLRTWMVTLRGAMHDDPIVFAATDRLTWCIAGACGLLLGLAKWASTGLPGVVP